MNFGLLCVYLVKPQTQRMALLRCWTTLCLVLALCAESWTFLHAPTATPCPVGPWVPLPDSQHGQPRRSAACCSHQRSSARLWRLALRMTGTARGQQDLADGAASSPATTGHDTASDGPQEQVVTRGERMRGRGGGGSGGGGGGRDRDGGGGGGGKHNNKVCSNCRFFHQCAFFPQRPPLHAQTACSQFRV
jgi:uncharacterized membrane protein YgcG